MRRIFQQPGMKWIFIANFVSMIGSGMNSAGVTWWILQKTGSEMSLGWLIFLQAIPPLVLLPLSGVIIYREDRRHLVMWLDGIRGGVILLVALLALFGQVKVWQLYAMNVLVTAGFWMFWPTITALMQELTPQDSTVHANSFIMAGVQSGWLLAGASVGFLYNHIGLAGVLLIDVCTYVVSLSCYSLVRKGRVTVAPREDDSGIVHANATAKYFHEMGEGLRFILDRPRVIAITFVWAIFTAAMLTQNIVGAPLSEKILHAGAEGFGFLNSGWAVGAFASSLGAPAIIAFMTGKRAVFVSMAILTVCLAFLPFSGVLVVAVATYFIMGTARGVGGVAVNSTMMELVPKHFMGRVQNTAFTISVLLQLVSSVLVGWISHHRGLVFGFAIISLMYAVAFTAAAWPTLERRELAQASSD